MISQNVSVSAADTGGKKFYQKIMNNSKAFENCDVFGTHFYGTQRTWMDYPELENCVYTDSNNDADLWPNALNVSENIYKGLVVGNMSAYVGWDMLLNNRCGGWNKNRRSC